ncbi:MAG: HupE/UreJ family protein [Acidobacteria bacterium]|nr:HupE/UreJ family protein [Acidobacteriota bacterium]MBI3281308.1 HupE/UreJ family protein [Acidobacteriota bacterium]
MKRLAWLLALPLSAHTISMSTGELRVEGARARYELRMPLYEAEHVRNPEEALFANFTIRGARLTSKSCRTQPGEAMFYCEAVYEFPAPPEQIEVDCRFARVTVPNHVHLLRATSGGRTDQAVLDLSFDSATLRFRDPTPVEVAAAQISAGAWRAVSGLANLLFFVALVLAARTPRELALLALAFILGETAGALLALHLGWQISPRFIEAAMALSVAYIAVEVLFLPSAGQRWLVLGILGIFHGLYLRMFIQGSRYSPGYVLAGAAAAACLAVLALWFAGRLLRRAHAPDWAASAAASLLLVIGLGWFALRLYY